MIGRSTGLPRPSIELQIDELILDGFASNDRYRISAAIQRELVHLLSERGLPVGARQDEERPVLNGGSFAVQPYARPEAVGVQVARAIYGGLSK